MYYISVNFYIEEFKNTMNKTIAIGIFGIILFGCGTGVKEQTNKKVNQKKLKKPWKC